MATDRVGIEIDLMGYDEAMSQMQNLERSMKGLNGHRNRLKIEAEVSKLKMNRDALKAQKVKLEADTKDIDKKITRTTNELKRMQRTLKALNSDKSPFRGKQNQKAIASTEAAIRRLIEEIRTLNTLKVDIGSRMGNIQSEINQTTSAIQRMQAALRNVKTMGAGDIFKKVSSSVGHMGAAMQSAGNALNRLTAPMRMLTSGMLLGAGFGAVNKITEGLESGFSRYDTMNKYNRMMKSFEKGNYTAQKSIDELDKSVQGLPTSLDEMVNLSQRFTMTTGNMRRGTQLAIATNNAFMASMSTDTQRYQGMMQLQDVIGGKDMNAREWQSLANSMLPAIRMMGEDLGKSGKELDEWVSSVQRGKVSNEEFLDALVKTGTGMGKAAKMAEEAKNTWEAFSSRIGTAFSRMMYGGLQAMDEIVKSMGLVGKDGKAIETLNQLLDDKVINGINDLSKAAQGFIRSHADEIKSFFEDLGDIDWQGLGRGFMSGFSMIAKGIQDMAKYLKGKNLEGLGKAIFWMQGLATTLTVGGGLLKGGRHIIGGAVAAMTGIARGIGALASVMGGTAVVKGLKNMKLIKNLKWVSWFTKTFKGIGGATGAAAGAAGTAGGTAAAGAIIKGFLPAIEIIGGIGAVVTEITGIAALNTWIIKKGIDNIKEITGSIQDIITNVNGIQSTGLNKGALRDAVSAITDVYNILYGETGTTTRAANKANTGNIGGKKGFGDMSPRKLKKSADAIGQMLKMFSDIGGVMDTLPNLVEKRKNLNMDTFRNIFGGENGLLAQFGAITDDINKYMGKGTGITDVSASVDGMKNTFDSLTAIVKMIPQLTKQLASVTGGGAGTGNGMSQLETLKQQLTGESGVFATIQSIMVSMNETLFGGGNARNGALAANSKGAGQGQGGALTSGSVSKMSGAMESIKSAFDSIKGIITTMTEMQSSLAALTTSGAQGSAITNITTQIQQLMQGVGQITTAINTSIGNAGDIASKTDGLVTAINNIKSVVTKLNSLGEGGLAEGGSSAAFGAIQQIKNMVTQLGNALNTETLGTLRMQVSNFKASVDQIFETLNGDLSNVQVTVVINGKVTGDDKLIAEIASARRNILNAVNRIPSTITKNVTVNVNPHVNAGSVSMPSASSLVHPHTGGFISGHGLLYRAKGGSIFDSIFKPKGTDTVPAMLTPGEYVQRREAVDTFGVRFMQKVNNLDVAGAFRELSARMGSTIARRGGTTIYNNNITNNSPTINQTVNTRNPDFVFRRPSRYITAL